MIEIVDFRILLAGGIALTTVGLLMLSAAKPPDALIWLVIGSTLQSVGGGGLLTCFSTISFSTLRAGNADRRIGRVQPVAAARLRLRRGADDGGAARQGERQSARDGGRVERCRRRRCRRQMPRCLNAYSACFRAMAVAALFMLPGIWLFRARPLGRSVVDPV